MATQTTTFGRRDTGDNGGPRQNNRDRILDASLELFNERGTVAVSTKTIAAHLGISPGNLYYHFANKEEIIRELWSRAERAVLPTMVVPDDDSVLPPGALAAFFVTVTDSMWSFRCFSRNVDELVSRDAEFAKVYESKMGWARDQLLAMFDSLLEHGVMSAPQDQRDLERLAINLLLHLQNWTRFLTTGCGKTHIGPGDLADGGLHAFLLLEPYLDPDYAEQVRAVIERRVKEAKKKQRDLKIAGDDSARQRGQSVNRRRSSVRR